MARRVPKGQQTREQILATALELFAAHGFQAVTVEQIAADAGVTKGAVYHWFADKDDIGRELQHQLNERLSARAAAAFEPGGDLVDNLTRAFGAWLDALGDHDEARFFLRDAWVIPVLDEAGRSDHEASVELARGVLQAAIDRGEIVALDAHVLARALIGAWAELTLHVLRTGDRQAALDVVHRLTSALRTDPPGAPT